MKEKNILKKAYNLKRITPNEAKILFTNTDILTLADLAHHIRLNKCNPNTASYIIDRNINYTNGCISKCKFCAFYKEIDHNNYYVLDNDSIKQKILETKSLNGTGILLQGGLNPKLKIDFYTSLLKFIKSVCDIHIHAFSPPEITYISKINNISIKETIAKLINAGLNSIPGGGAEILVDSIRKEISPNKYTSHDWLYVMKTAHSLNLKTTATMMFGHIESIDDRIEHITKIRDLQDKTNGFTAFIPWTFQKGNSKLNVKPSSCYDYLKTLAISRIFIDNIKNIQGSWVTQGEEIGQLSLRFGANDLGSIMIEENVVKSAGTNYKLNESKMIKLIKEAGFIPFKRNTLYTNQ